MGHEDADFSIDRSRKFLDAFPAIEEARARYEKTASELNSSKLKLDEVIREVCTLIIFSFFFFFCFLSFPFLF
jgi:hypothetical protein